MLKKSGKILGYFCNIGYINIWQVKVKAFSYFVDGGSLLK